MSVKRSKKPTRRGGRAASKTGGHRRAKYQPWRTSNGKVAPVVTILPRDALYARVAQDLGVSPLQVAMSVERLIAEGHIRDLGDGRFELLGLD